MTKNVSNKSVPEKSTKVQYIARDFMTNYMVIVEFSLSLLSATIIVSQKCHMNDSTSGRYDMIISRDLLTTIGIDLKFTINTIE